jgi:two-component system cell cycle sensor histidine kinase/response regulator CckA
MAGEFDVDYGYRGSLLPDGDSSHLPAAELLALVVDQVPAVVWTTDLDLVVTLAGGVHLRLLTPNQDNAVGTHLFELIGTRDPSSPLVQAHVGALEGKSSAFDLEWKEIWYSARVTPLTDRSGSPIGVVGAAFDITKQKTTELRLAAEREEYELRVLNSQKMEAIGQLAGGIAHDFNNALQVIRSSATFIAEDLGDDDPKVNDARRILESSESASRLVQQLLVFANRQTGRPTVVDVDETILGLLELLEHTTGESIRLMTRLSSQRLPVHIDQTQLEQLMIDLALNARDAMPAGGDLVIATDLGPAPSRADLPTGQYVHLSVQDTGMGMSEEVGRRAFEPFFTTKPLGTGSGLGLATVYGIARRAGGIVTLESREDEGTRIDIYLPLHEDDVIPSDALQPGGESEPALILVVEDEDPVRRIAERLLTRAGYRVLAAASGEEGLRLFKDHDGPIDLLLTDVVMPNMSGRELARRLRMLDASLRILFMSGFADDAITGRGGFEEDEDFLQKPFDNDELLARVAAALERP